MRKKTSASSTGSLAKKTWQFLSNIPKGNIIFSKLVGFLIPYTGSIKPVVLKLEHGYAAVKLKDRRSVRNHLKSVHAIALANLGEFTTGLSLIPQLDHRANAILTKLEVIYIKKARGVLTAEATASIPSLVVGDSQHIITANITNCANELVCQVFATWQVRVSAS